jgi:multicomponent Na+:H+ antiporter subunit D
MSIALPVFIVVPLVTAFILPLFGMRQRAIASGLATMATLVVFGLVILSIGQTGEYVIGRWPIPLGINLVKDGLSTLMLLAISVVSVAATLFSCRYMETYTGKPKFLSLLLLMVAGMNGVVLSGDIFNMFVFLEIASIASYALVGFGCEHQELEAAFKYTILGSIGAAFILLGIGLFYGYTGTLNLKFLAQAIHASRMNEGLLFALALFIVGFGLKAALVPFHAWLPDAHQSAPAPVSAMLSGIIIKALGVYALVRIVFNVVGITLTLSWVIMGLGLLSMVVGAFLALGQWDLKRLLAYSSISQVGYIILGMGMAGLILSRDGNTVWASLAVLGGLLHLINHAVYKSLLFLTSGSIEMSTGTRELLELGGLREKLPATRTVCAVASASIVGIPPFSGFWSKLILVIVAVQARLFWIAAVIVLISVCTLIMYLKVHRYVFLGSLPDKYHEIQEHRGSMLIAMVFLAVLSATMGLLLLVPGLRESILEPAVKVVTGGFQYAAVVMNI